MLEAIISISSSPSKGDGAVDSMRNRFGGEGVTGGLE